MKKLVVFLCLTFFWMVTLAQNDQKVRMLVNAGQDQNTHASFSPDNSLVAMVNMSKLVEVFDVRTGLLVRKVNLDFGVIPRQLIFEGNDKIHVVFAYGGDNAATINVPTGEVTETRFADLPEIDKSDYDMTKEEWYRFYNYFFIEKNDGTYYYTSPNEKEKIEVSKVSDDETLPGFRFILSQEGKKSVIFDELPYFSFLKVVFSRDSKLALIDNIIFSIEEMKEVSRIERVSPFGSSAIFEFLSDVPAVLSSEGILSIDSLKPLGNFNEATKILKLNECYGLQQYDFEKKEQWYSIFSVDFSREISRILLPIQYIPQETSEGNKYLLAKDFQNENAWVVIDLRTGKAERTILNHDSKVNVSFVGNEIVVNEKETCYRIDLDTGDSTNYLLKELDSEENNISLVADGYILKYNLRDRIVRTWDLSEGNKVAEYKLENPTNIFGYKIEFDLQNQEIISYTNEKTVLVLDFFSGEVKKKFDNHKGTITQFEISENRELALSCSVDGKSIIWDYQNNDIIAKVFSRDINNLIIAGPDNFYLSKTNQRPFVHFAKGKKVFPLEQFDLKYNRPDIILDRLGYADSSLIAAYHQAYLKRLKKMNFTEEMLKDDFHLPEIEIKNFEAMPTMIDENNIDLNLHLEDSKYPLDRINIWINDVAILGTNGISLRDLNTQALDKTVNIPLVKGENKIQVSVLNQAGAESYKETVELECTAGKTKPDLYLIAIGESEFQQNDFNLTYAAKDAEDMAKLFSNSKVYNQVFTKTLTNQEVTKDNVLNLKSFLQQADINDQVMIFLAGHGVLSADLDYYLATYDMNFNKPEERGLMYEELESLLDGIKPLKKTLILDACHSGEIDKEEMELAVAENTEEGDVQFRAVNHTVKSKLGSQNTLELTKSLFTDLRKGTGATVISSAGGMEFAMESGDWQNGLFTYALLNGIKSGAADLNKDGEIWLSELQEYVGEEVTRMSNGLQQPTSRIENQTVDFRVW